MKRILPLVFLLLTLLSHAQQPGQVAGSITALKGQGVQFPIRSLFQQVQRSLATDLRWSAAISNAEVLALDQQAITSVLAQRPSYFALELPSLEGIMVLDLEYVEIFTTDFTVLKASTNSAASIDPGAHYRGMVRGVPGSIAAISIFNNEVMGLVSDAEGDHVLGRLADGTDDMHVFYREADLLVPHTATCDAVDDGEVYDPSVILMEGSPKTTKCVRFYWEVNYDIFQGKGSVANATSYVTGLFNQSATLYANDGISVLLSQVFVWDVASPYTQTNTGDLLDQFGVTRTSFNGDLAHLLGYAGGGGIAWLNTLCSSNTSARMAYSDINSTYQNVPTYSWSVEVVTHEQGHNLGSKHTHACAWNGNNTAIDGCGPAAGYSEGSCAQGPLPSSTVGGTIMSYCHLTSSTIKFANGFGPQPAALIVSKVNNGTCLTNCATTCNAPSGLSAGSITMSSALLSWTVASGAVTYNLQWKPASSGTWTTITGITGTSYSLMGLGAGAAYNFQVMTVCSGGSSAYATAVNFTTSTAACAVPSGLSVGSITSSSASLSWGAVTGAVSYNLQWKLSSAGTWTTVNGITATSHALSGLAASSSYDFQVMTACSGNSSAYSSTASFTTSAAACADGYEPNGTQATAAPVVPNLTLNALISSGTDIDWFTFANTSTQKNIRVRLMNLPANYNLSLFRGGTLLLSSANTGTTSETIVLNNGNVSSVYRVRVKGVNSSTFNATQCYTLSVEIGATVFSMPEGMSEGDEAIASHNAGITLFPNPANDVLTIVLPPHQNAATIELLDATGRVVHTEKQGSNDAPSPFEISVADRTEGLYMVRVTIDDETNTQRLIVTR